MKKLIFVFLLVASLLVTSSVVYAATYDFTFVENEQNEIWVYYNGYDSFGERDVSDSGNSLLNFNLLNYADYDMQTSYTMHVSVDSSNFIAYENYESVDLFENFIWIWDRERSSEIEISSLAQDWRIEVYFTYVESDSSPVLDGDTAFITTIDDPIAVSTIESYISAYDETDGSLSHAIEFVDSARDLLAYIVAKGLNDGDLTDTTVTDELSDYDNGTLNVSLMGQTFDNATIDMFYSSAYIDLVYDQTVTALEPLEGAQEFYVLDYYVSDSAGNYSTLEVQVFVKDVLSPVGTDASATVSYTNTYDISTYLTNSVPALFVDNYDLDEDLTFVVHDDSYTANKTIPGTYEVEFKATDTSGNIGYAILTLTVVDDVNPVFSGPSTITKNTSETLTLSEITSQLSANDVIDGTLTSSIVVISDDFTGHGNIVGSYDIEYAVTDSAGNTAYHTVTINAVDNIPPVFFVADGYFISVEQSISLDLQDFIDILEATGQISVDGSGGVTVVSAYNEYFGNESTPGIYALTLTGASVAGDEYIWNLAVEVVATSDDDSTTVEDLPFYEEFWHDHEEEIITGGIILVLIFGVIGLGVYASKSVKKNTKKSKRRK